MFVYVGLAERLIVGVEWPAQNTVLYASVGTVRTDFANRTFAGKTDSYMLAQEGVTDESVNELWTPESVSLARSKLFFSYFGLFCLFNACIGSFSQAKELRETRV